MNDVVPSLSKVPSRFLDQLRRCIRTKGLAYTTEKTYVYSVKFYINYHHKRHPQEMGAQK